MINKVLVIEVEHLKDGTKKEKIYSYVYSTEDYTNIEVLIREIGPRLKKEIMDGAVGIKDVVISNNVNSIATAALKKMETNCVSIDYPITINIVWEGSDYPC